MKPVRARSAEVTVPTSRWHRWFKVRPQWAALLLLLLSWILLQLLLPLWAHLAQAPVAATSLAAAQGALAAALAWFCALPLWWVLIDAAFPLAVYHAMQQSWPSYGFWFPLLVLGAVYGTSFLTRVPYYPSRPVVRELLAGLLSPVPGQRVIDIGSGLGGLGLALARRRPDCQVVGIELAWLPWLLSWLRARRRRCSSVFLWGDYRRHSLSDYDLVFAYLSPAAMPALWLQLQRELAPGALFVSCEFSVPAQPTCLLPGSGVRGVPPLYVWRMGSDRVLKAGQ